MQNMSLEANEQDRMLSNPQERAGEAWLVYSQAGEVSFELRSTLSENCMRQAGHMLVDSIVENEFAGSFVCDVQKLDGHSNLFSFAVRAAEPVDERLADALRDSTPENCL